MKKIVYNQPRPDGTGNELVAVTKQEAIAIQRELVARLRPDFVYKDDEEALLDYMTINWAWLEESDK
jgi:hypothetical protein